MNKSISALLADIRDNQIQIHVKDGNLLCSDPAKRMTDALRQRIRHNKDDLIRAFARQSADDSSPLAAIAPAEAREHYPATSQQSRLYVLHQLDPNSVAYNMPAAYELSGGIDPERAQAAIDACVARHEPLRTRFELRGGQLAQIVLESAEAKLEVERVPEDSIQGAIAAFARPFDLARAPLLRAKLLLLPSGAAILLTDMHHIVSDGVSNGALIRDFSRLYAGEALKPLALQYKDYSVWQQEGEGRALLARQAEYWKGQYAEPPPVLDLPTDFPRPRERDFSGATLRGRLEPERAERLRALCRRSGATMHMLLLAGFSAVLSRLSGQEDIVVGNAVAGRDRPELEGALGMFVNTLPIRLRPERGARFEDYLRQVKTLCLEALRNQHCPLEQLLDQLPIERDPARNPLFDAMLVARNFQRGAADGELAAARPYPFDTATSKFDLTLSASEEADGALLLDLEYAASLFAPETARRIAARIERLLLAAADDPSQKLGRIDILDTQERDLLLRRFNAAERAYPAGKRVHELFAEQAARAPGAVAVSIGGQSLTYRELDARSNALARALREARGIGPDDLVGLCLERSLEMVVAILGVLKSGGAYLPIDPTYPVERIDFMLRDAEAKALIIDGEAPIGAIGYDGPVLDARSPGCYHPDTSPLPNANSASDLAYVIYTSGSTGQPKGVMVEHGNVVRLFSACQDWFGFGPGDVWTMFHYYGFDFSVWEIFGALLHGGRLVIAPHETTRSPEAFLKLLETERVTVLSQTPSAFRLLIAADAKRALPSDRLALRHVVFGGEALEFESLRPWIERYGDDSPQLINMYGITETTVHVTYKRVRKEDLDTGKGSVIGVPIPDLRVHALDAERQLQPVGVVGELYVGGAGVSRGYLNRADLTAERFVEDPFQPGERLYRSGDLGRWLPSGELEYLGRIDDQAQIRGFRVELGEIAAALLRLDGAREAVAIVGEEDGEQALWAYYVGDRELAPAEARAALRKRLPDYMIPSRFVRMERIPLTSNGKVDRKRLPQPDIGSARASVVEPPRNETEAALLRLWQEILRADAIGIRHDFFELGGHSIKAIQLVGRINEAYGTALHVGDLYKHPTIEALSESINNQAARADLAARLAAGNQEIARFEERLATDSGADLPGDFADVYPLSPIELGMIFTSKLAVDQPVYYDQFVYGFQCDDAERIASAFAQLVERHDILRTRYYTTSYSEPAKIVMRRAEPLPVEFEDLRALDADAQRAAISRYQSELSARRFEFDGEILWSVRCFRVDGDGFVCVLFFHHSALDGWSVNRLIGELQILLAAVDGESPLPPLRSSYKDYCALQLGSAASPENARFWKRRLEGCVRNKLPFNYSGKPKRKAVGMDFVRRQPEPELLERLQELARSRRTSLKSVFLAAQACLARLASGEREIVTGVVSHDRPSIPDAEKIVGCFLNTIPARIQLSDEQTPEALIRALHVYLVESSEREMHLTEVARAVGVNSGNANPFFDCLLNFTDFAAIDGDEAAPLARNPLNERFAGDFRNEEMTNTLFDLEVDKTGDRLSIRIKYSPSYFDREDVEYALDLYVRILNRFADEPARALDPESLLTPKERAHLTRGFNDTLTEYSREETLHGLFEKRAAQHPDALALRQNGARLTYGELNARANRLARRLAARGIAPGESVGLISERSFDMVVGMLGILKAGGAYVPVDPAYPAQRQSYILRNSAARLAVVDRLPEEAPDDIALLKISAKDDAARADSDLKLSIEADQLAYTIYTSGSTGKPKGVMITHTSAVNLVEWVKARFGVNESDRILGLSSMCFDLSVYDIFGALAAGASIVIATADQTRDFAELKRLVVDERITFWNSVPTTMDYLVRDIERERAPFQQMDLRIVFMSGDWIPVGLPDRIRLFFPNAAPISLGGATEGAVWSNYFPIKSVDPSWSSIPYGWPIANNFFYIVDDAGRLVPPGAVGELCIGGIGVAVGYANDRERTDAAFGPDRFNDALGGRLYRTGDLGRMSPHGYMEFLGRKDHQVKIRGYRVELGEVESALVELEEIREAVAVVRDLDGEKTLVAYCVADVPLDPASIRARLATTLPAYMAPTRFAQLPALPLTANGKIDRRALPEPNASLALAAAHVPPATETERALAQIWSETLRLDLGSVSAAANFYDLGGDSLSMIRVASRARWSGIHLTVRQMMEHQNIQDLARHIDEAPRAAASEAENGARHYMPMMRPFLRPPIRKRFLITSRFEVAARLDLRALREAVAALYAYHDSLRMRLAQRGGAWESWIEPAENIDLDGVLVARDLSLLEPEAQENALYRESHDIRPSVNPFDGANFKILLLDFGDTRPQALHLFTHHFAADGVAVDMIKEDLINLYLQAARGEPLSLPAKTASLAQIANALEAAHRDPALLDELPYWRSRPWERVKPAPFDFPVDEDANTYDSHAHFEAYLGAEETRVLLEALPETGASMLDALYLAYVEAIGDWSGAGAAQAYTVDARGMLSQCAPELDATRTAGWFASYRMFVVTRPESDDVIERLRAVAEERRAAPNGGLGFAMLESEGDASPASAFFKSLKLQTFLLNYYGVADSAPGKQILQPVLAKHGERTHDAAYTCKHDCILHLGLVVVDGRLKLSTECSMNLFKQSTIESFFARFLGELSELARALQSTLVS